MFVFQNRRIAIFIYKVYSWYTMDTTTVKIHRSTKTALHAFKDEHESYDTAIKKLITHLKDKNLKKELIMGYQRMGKADLELLEEWDSASKELNEDE